MQRRPPEPIDDDYVESLLSLARGCGLEHVGVAPASIMSRARDAILERKAAGLSDSMQFTFRNPARSTDPGRAVNEARAMLVAARSYVLDSPPPPEAPGPYGVVARYAWVDHYAPLRRALQTVVRKLRRDGYKAVAFADDNSLVDREAAWLAGIGWFGKNANLLVPGQGSFFVLGSVITTAPLPPASEPVADGCGTCRRCIDGCPTAAIVAPGVVDASRCLAWLLQRPGIFPRQFREALGTRIYGCDECQTVCPPTVRFERRRPVQAVGDVQAMVSLLDMLEMDDDALLAAYGRWYLADRNPAWLRRNALIALGNASDDGPAVASVIGRFLAGDDAMLRAHAVWAAARLGLHHLLPTTDPDKDVADELAVARRVKHLLVTNDFPPKIGGIQSLLWEWWRRLPPDSFAVLTSPYKGAEEFDAEQPFRVERVREPVLLPHPWMARRIDELAAEIGAELVVLDPALPLGLVGPSLQLPYDVVLHGAEVTVPGRLPASKQALGYVLRRARHVIAAGSYPAAEAELAAGAALPITIVPPGVDTERFHPLEPDQRLAARRRFGLPEDAELIVSISRLVPRKGFDTAIRAVATLKAARPNLVLAIAGGGRDRARLETLVRDLGAPVRFLGRVPNDELAQLYGCADIYTMVCRNRWGGLEQEGFGIVFVEAAACGVVQVAGDSGGAAEAVADGTTGIVVRRPEDPREVARAFVELLDDPQRRETMGAAARRRAVAEFSYDVLAERLGKALGALA